MPAAVITPIFDTDVATTIEDLTAGPPAGEEWVVDVRACNTTAGAISYRLFLTTSADNSQSVGTYRAYDYAIDPNDAVDVERGLLIPNGYKLQHRASATGLDVSVTGRKRSAS